MNLRQPEPEAPEPEPTDTAVVTLISDDYYRFDDIYNYSYESVTGSSYTERGVGNQNRVHYATGEGETGLNSQSHSWYLETLSVDEDETIDAYTESGVTNTTAGVRNSSESLRSVEDSRTQESLIIPDTAITFNYQSGDRVVMSSKFDTSTGFTSTENQFSFAHTVASKPPKVVNQLTGELEPDPAADADGYVYETTTGSSASVLEWGTTGYQSQEKYQKDHYELVSSGGYDFDENSVIQPIVGESHQTQNAWSNGTESYYLAAGDGTTLVDDLVTSTSYSRYDIPFSTGFSTYDSNSTSSSGDDSTTSVSHVETTTTETMTSGSTAKSRSGKDTQGRPFAESRNVEQFDRFTTELTIDYGHVIDKEGSHELPTFYDTETFEAIVYKSNAISTNRFSLPNGARNSQSQYERDF